MQKTTLLTALIGLRTNNLMGLTAPLTFHSSSYTANPVACAAAKANLDLWKGQECHRRIAAVATMQEQAIEGFRADPRFANVRRSGTITALDLKTRDTGYLAGVGPRLHAFLTTAISCCVHSVIRFM